MKFFTIHLFLVFLTTGISIAEILYYDHPIPEHVRIPSDRYNYTMDKKKNLIIYGIPATEQQDQGTLVRAVLKVFQLQKLNVDLDHLLIIKRLGKTMVRSTAVLVHFAAQSLRLEVLKRRDVLKGTGYEIVLDMPKIISYRHRLIKPLYEKLIRQGTNATIIWGKLIVDGKVVPDDVVEKYLFTTSSIRSIKIKKADELDYSDNRNVLH